MKFHWNPFSRKTRTRTKLFFRFKYISVKYIVFIYKQLDELLIFRETRTKVCLLFTDEPRTEHPSSLNPLLFLFFPIWSAAFSFLKKMCASVCASNLYCCSCCYHNFYISDGGECGLVNWYWKGRIKRKSGFKY